MTYANWREGKLRREGMGINDILLDSFISSTLLIPLGFHLPRSSIQSKEHSGCLDDNQIPFFFAFE